MLAQHSELKQRYTSRKSTKSSPRDRGHHQHRERVQAQRRRQGIKMEKGDLEWMDEDRHRTSSARFRDASSFDVPSSAPLTRKKRRNKAAVHGALADEAGNKRRAEHPQNANATSRSLPSDSLGRPEGQHPRENGQEPASIATLSSRVCRDVATACQEGRKTRRQAGVPGGVSTSSSRETLRLDLGASIGVNMHDEKQPRMTRSELENFAERAPFLSISTYGKYLEAHNLLPIVAAYYDESTESHWQGCVCVLHVEDTTANTQAEAMLHTITNVLHYPPERILCVGSDTLAMGDDLENEPGYLFEQKLSALMELGISETKAAGVPPIDG